MLNVDSIAVTQALLQEESHFTVVELRKQMAAHFLLVVKCAIIYCILSEQLKMSEVSA